MAQPLRALVLEEGLGSFPAPIWTAHRQSQETCLLTCEGTRHLRGAHAYTHKIQYINQKQQLMSSRQTECSK